MSKKVMISAGEASGELYGAMLSRQLKRNWPDIDIFGIGGAKMQAEGVSLLAPISHVLGITEALSHLFEIRKTFKKAKAALINRSPDVLVLIDYPDFNIALAKKAKSAGIPILYYVSPQVWAWRKGRTGKIASLVSRMAVLFPFEVDYYRNTGLDCEFVGHPVAESIDINLSKEELKKKLGLSPSRRLITILPGSRPNEIRKHSSTIIEIADKFKKEFPDIQIAVPLLSGTDLGINLPQHITIIHDRTVEALACSDAAAVASGTATLQTALVGTPMVVFYKVSPLTYFIGRTMSLVKFISLVNLLSGREVVKELLQNEASAENIYGELKKILQDDLYRKEMTDSLEVIKETMKNKTPSVRVAEMVGEVARW